jgi:DNA-binding beta-propeller fold protein YncE
MRNSWPIVAISCVLLLAGCSGVPVTTPIVTNPVPGVALKGIVHGGQQPIVGAHVYLYAANSNGYGGASTSLLLNKSGTTKDGNSHYYVTTGAGGAFSISGDYTCPSGTAQVYLYAIGGDPTPGVPNAAAGLLAGLGSCNSPNFASQFVVVNEVSTITTAYALAGFTTDPTHIASSSTALSTMGITDAFNSIANLLNLSTGLPLATTPAGNGTVPQAEINTLADILAACINSTGPSSTECTTLFSNAMNGTTAPADTATAAINIAHNPGANIDNLYGLATANSPFQPTISEPNDFTVAVTYTGGGLDGSGFAPEGIAVDGSGNIWVPNFQSGTLSELNYLGVVAASGSTGFGQGALNNPTSVAIDASGLVSVANFYGNSLTQFFASGAVRTKPQGSGLSNPYGIAIDTGSNIWVSNFGSNTLSEFQSSGAPSSGSGGFAGVTEPGGIAADTSGDVWVTNFGASVPAIVEASPNKVAGQPPVLTVVSENQLNSPYGIAVDGSGDIWVTNSGTGSITEFHADGSIASPDPNGFTGGGLANPYGIAIDGIGNVWTANNGGNSNSVSEFNSNGMAMSGTNGYVGTGLFPYGIAIDPSGNVWVANKDTSAPLTEFVGAAAPVVTPLAAAAAYGELGTEP